MNFDDIFLNRFPSIDLHGLDRDMARVMVNDFVDEAIQMGYSNILIVHGIGEGILREVVQNTLFKRKDIVDFYIVPENIGCTMVKIK